MRSSVFRHIARAKFLAGGKSRRKKQNEDANGKAQDCGGGVRHCCEHKCHGRQRVGHAGRRPASGRDRRRRDTSTRALALRTLSLLVGAWPVLARSAALGMGRLAPALGRRLGLGRGLGLAPPLALRRAADSIAHRHESPGRTAGALVDVSDSGPCLPSAGVPVFPFADPPCPRCRSAK
jgi:hypothetical protein